MLNLSRCEHTLANAAGEAQALTEAARTFLQVEDASQMLCCPSFEEHLNAAVNCYSHAVRVRCSTLTKILFLQNKVSHLHSAFPQNFHRIKGALQ